MLVELLRLVLRFFGRQEVQPLRELAADARTLVNEVTLRMTQLDFEVVLHPGQRWHHAARKLDASGGRTGQKALALHLRRHQSLSNAAHERVRGLGDQPF